MKAIQFNRYGPPEVLSLEETQRPVPGRGEVLVRVVAAAVNPKDCLVRKGKFRRMTGRRFPLTLGYDFAGTVVECGPGVRAFKKGTPVHGMLNGWKGGAYAEYATAPVDEIAAMPSILSTEQAAAMPLAALTALQALRDLAGVSPGDKVLINGASGGVGTFAIQIAKVLGAEVTAVSSEANTILTAELGADAVLDYRRTDPIELDERFQTFFDVFGNKSFAAARRLLTPRGRYITTVPNPANLFWHAATRASPLKRGLLVVVRSKRRDLEYLDDLVAAARLHPVIDRTYPLNAAAEAHRYVETKRARGKVVLLV